MQNSGRSEAQRTFTVPAQAVDAHVAPLGVPPAYVWLIGDL